MNVLALEISSARGSIALLRGGKVDFDESFANDRRHSGAFFEALKACVRASDRIETIAVGLGPGSYAGVRIAISAANGLAVAQNASLRGLPSIVAIDTDAPDYAVVGDARRGSFFWAVVVAGECTVGPVLVGGSELRERITASPVPVFRTERVEAFEDVPVAYPAAVRLAKHALTSATAEPPLEPIYLREPYITTPAPPRQPSSARS